MSLTSDRRAPHHDEQPVRAIAVAVLADDALARAGLVALCTAAGLSVVFARAAHAAAPGQARAALVAEPGPSPEVLVYDLGHGGGRAQDAFGAFGAFAQVPIVALVASEGDARAALAAGARAALARTVDDPAVLASALAAVSRGLYVSAFPLASGAGASRGARGGSGGSGGSSGEAGPNDELTARELDVLRGLTEGLSNKRIAARLFISEHTVKTHVNAILAKLGAESRTDAVVRAARLGLVLL